MQRYKKSINTQIYKQMHNISESTYLLLILYSSTIPTMPYASATEVHAHSCRLYQAYAHKDAEPILILTTQDSDLQTQS